MSEDLRDKITAAIDRAEHDAMRRLNGVPMIGCVGLHAEPLAVLRRCAADRRVLERHRPLSGTEVWSVDALYPVCAEEWGDGDGYRIPWHACPEVIALADRWGVEP